MERWGPVCLFPLTWLSLCPGFLRWLSSSLLWAASSGAYTQLFVWSSTGPAAQDGGGLRIQAIHSLGFWAGRDPSQWSPHLLSHRPHLYILPWALPMQPFLSFCLDSPSWQKAAISSPERERERALCSKAQPTLRVPAQAQVINNTSVPAKVCRILPSRNSLASWVPDTNMEQRASICWSLWSAGCTGLTDLRPEEVRAERQLGVATTRWLRERWVESRQIGKIFVVFFFYLASSAFYLWIIKWLHDHCPKLEKYKNSQEN